MVVKLKQMKALNVLYLVTDRCTIEDIIVYSTVNDSHNNLLVINDQYHFNKEDKCISHYVFVDKAVAIERAAAQLQIRFDNTKDQLLDIFIDIHNTYAELLDIITKLK